MESIDTERLRLVAQTKESSKAAIEDRSLFAQLLTAAIPNEWPNDMMADAEPYFADKLTQDPAASGWWGWYILLKSTSSDKDILIGSAGFLGRPSPEGALVLGYSILDDYQRNGYATEACKALIQWAFHHQAVQCIAAETFPTLPLSIRVLEKCGFTYAGPGSEEGTIRYECTK